jgi:hypothetical protein
MGADGNKKQVCCRRGSQIRIRGVTIKCPRTLPTQGSVSSRLPFKPPVQKKQRRSKGEVIDFWNVEALRLRYCFYKYQKPGVT